MNWMTLNSLKLDADKTALIRIVTKVQRQKLFQWFSIDILGQQITPTEQIRNL